MFTKGHIRPQPAVCAWGGMGALHFFESLFRIYPTAFYNNRSHLTKCGMDGECAVPNKFLFNLEFHMFISIFDTN